MEICYYWIDRFGNTIKEQGYDFGSQLTFNFNYEQNQLIIRENPLYVEGFFNFNNDKQIKNITAIVGRNGVGKSTFLKALKGLLIDGGILATPKNDGEVYYYKRILVYKYEGKYKVIFHNDLISSSEGKLDILYENSELENRYEIEFISYGKGENIHPFRKDLFRVRGTEAFSSTSCVYFSHAFENNFYSDSSREDRKYFDISTKGLLNEIQNDFRPSNTFSTTKPNHLIKRRDTRFNVGVLKEFHIKENNKRIELLSDDIGKKILENHLFFPEKAYLNLDYIIYKQDNFSFLDIDPSNLLRTEKNKDELNKIETYILNLIEGIYKTKSDDSIENSLLLAKQTYLRRIFDSYFEDVDRFIFFNRRKRALKEAFENIADEELQKRDLLQLLDFFSQLTIKELQNDSNIDDFEQKFNAEQFKTLTQSYKDFIIFFYDYVLTESSIINVIKGTIGFVTTESKSTQAAGYKEVGIIEIELNSEGVRLLKQFVNHYESINTLSNFTKIQWGGLSTGEDTLLTIYSRFFELRNENLSENVIILLDEIEHSLHPEWQRRILNNLIEYLPYVFSKCNSIQMVLATNVPFLLADIPTKNIVYIEKSKGKIKDEVRINSKPELINQTFAANIHSLLINNFFMESTIGEFSARKIEEIIQILKPVNTEEYGYSLQDISNTIQTIGEPIIRNKLESMYSEKFGENTKQTINRLIEEFKQEENYSPQKVNYLLDTILLKAGKEHKDD
ncbi:MULTISPECIES: AAA family ATPase [Priestia]|uniref:AAA family ATPase n=1 Tax=Priestia TaxID=2800373 RepID=UPI001C8E437E|nr:AAA family ATPase [Priestia aryabhattai]MBY0214867.1 AAA family ATPase [Priestia aryabhattai]